jgi:UTP:GlnB (protein PII) uridylyltransferase
VTQELIDADPFVHEFALSMPPGYREIFDRRAMREHAQLVAQRGNQPGFAAVWRTLPRGLAVLCVAADDHPGLLSVVTTVFVLHRLDVVTAQVFCRSRPDGSAEAVDFFWVRHPDRSLTAPPSEDHLERCVRTIVGFLRAGVEPNSVVTGPLSSPSSATPPRVEFDAAAAAQGESALIIEASDGSGLLMAIARSLYQSDVTIIASEIATRDKRVYDRFTLLARDGTKLSRAQQETVRTNVTAALEAWQSQGAMLSAS